MEIKIQTERLNLRLVSTSDLYSVHKLHSLPEVDKYNVLGIPGSIEDTKIILDSWIRECHLNSIINYTFVIERNEGEEFIGLFGLKIGHEKYKLAEVWYKLHPDYWNNGYATEALRVVLDFGFDKLNLHRIEAGCAVDNLGSIRVLEKVGMQCEGRKRQVLPLKSGWADNFHYAILATDKR